MSVDSKISMNAPNAVVIRGGVIHAPICKKLKNKLQRSNQKAHRDLCENLKGKNHEESSTIICGSLQWWPPDL